jgi:hypothetical protein
MTKKQKQKLEHSLQPRLTEDEARKISSKISKDLAAIEKSRAKYQALTFDFATKLLNYGSKREIYGLAARKAKSQRLKDYYRARHLEYKGLYDFTNLMQLKSLDPNKATDAIMSAEKQGSIADKLMPSLKR